MHECVLIFYYIAKMEVTYMNIYAVVHPYKRPYWCVRSKDISASTCVRMYCPLHAEHSWTLPTHTHNAQTNAHNMVYTGIRISDCLWLIVFSCFCWNPKCFTWGNNHQYATPMKPKQVKKAICGSFIFCLFDDWGVITGCCKYDFGLPGRGSSLLTWSDWC